MNNGPPPPVANECATCGGSGLIPFGLPSNGPDPCPDCNTSLAIDPPSITTPTDPPADSPLEGEPGAMGRWITCRHGRMWVKWDELPCEDDDA